MESKIQKPIAGLATQVAKLQEDPNNARVHDEKNLQTIMESLKRFGQTKPIVLASDGKTIIAGNGTFKAAVKLGWQTIAAMKSNLSASDATAYAIADNRTGELSSWDPKRLADQLQKMEASVQESIGYNLKQIERLVAADAKNGFRPEPGGFFRTKEEYEKLEIKNIHLFYNTEDYAFIVDWLDKQAERFGSDDHGQALMSHIKAEKNK